MSKSNITYTRQVWYEGMVRLPNVLGKTVHATFSISNSRSRVGMLAINVSQLMLRDRIHKELVLDPVDNRSRNMMWLESILLGLDVEQSQLWLTTPRDNGPYVLDCGGLSEVVSDLTKIVASEC